MKFSQREAPEGTGSMRQHQRRSQRHASAPITARPFSDGRLLQRTNGALEEQDVFYASRKHGDLRTLLLTLAVAILGMSGCTDEVAKSAEALGLSENKATGSCPVVPTLAGGNQSGVFCDFDFMVAMQGLPMGVPTRDCPGTSVRDVDGQARALGAAGLDTNQLCADLDEFTEYDWTSMGAPYSSDTNWSGENQEPQWVQSIYDLEAGLAWIANNFVPSKDGDAFRRRWKEAVFSKAAGLASYLRRNKKVNLARLVLSFQLLGEAAEGLKGADLVGMKASVPACDFHRLRAQMVAGIGVVTQLLAEALIKSYTRR